jgi:hypothetical protein
LKDIIGKLVRYGSISEKQESFLHKLVDKVDNHATRQAEYDAKREAERQAADPCPTGRVEITGEVISTKVQESQYGDQLKMLVKDDRGFKVWGSIPSSLQLVDMPFKQVIESEFVEQVRKNGHEITWEDDGTWTTTRIVQRGLEKGDRVTFTATVTPSNDDDKFGFYKRPSKAKMV